MGRITGMERESEVPPPDYMVYCVFSHLAAYIMANTAEDHFGMNSARIASLCPSGDFG